MTTCPLPPLPPISMAAPGYNLIHSTIHSFNYQRQRDGNSAEFLLIKVCTRHSQPILLQLSAPGNTTNSKKDNLVIHSVRDAWRGWGVGGGGETPGPAAEPSSEEKSFQLKLCCTLFDWATTKGRKKKPTSSLPTLCSTFCPGQ